MSSQIEAPLTDAIEGTLIDEEIEGHGMAVRSRVVLGEGFVAPDRPNMFAFEGEVLASGLGPRLNKLCCLSSVGDGAVQMVDGLQLDVLKPMMRLFRDGVRTPRISGLASPPIVRYIRLLC
jgi:hypothetical protein